MLTATAQAKLNLVLEVLEQREDGYHEIRGIAQTIALRDTLVFEEADGIQVTCTEPSLTHDNLVEHAARLVKNRYAPQRGARIHLQKRIPWAAGLGGGSSDAASTIRALNSLWNLNLNAKDLTTMACCLGSDVPLFLQGGTILLQGTGDIATGTCALPLTHVVLLVPAATQMPHKTASLYRRLKRDCFTRGQFTNAALFALGTGTGIPEDLMFNVFAKVAFEIFPGLQQAKVDFQEVVEGRVHLTGSGPCLFALQGTEVLARKAATELRSLGYDAYATHSTVAPDNLSSVSI